MCEKLALKSKPRKHCITHTRNIHDRMHITVKRPKVVAHNTDPECLFRFRFLKKSESEKTTTTITNINSVCSVCRDNKKMTIRYGYDHQIDIRSVLQSFITYLFIDIIE